MLSNLRSILDKFFWPPPSLVEGRVINAEGMPIPEVSLDVYSQPSDGPAHLLARGIADENGQFHLILTCPK